MELKSMKRAASEEREELVGQTEAPSYPYGLELHLENDAIDTLELAALPSVGQTMFLQARVSVTSVSEHESEHSEGKRRSIGLQITDMALGPDGEGPSQAERLFGDEA